MPPYSAPEYLLSSTGLCQVELQTQFEAFRSSLQYVATAPELVFERLVGNLALAFKKIVSQERAQRPAFQSDLDSATAAAELASVPTSSPPSQQVASAVCPSLVVLPAVVTAAEIPKQIYLQFWFSPSPDNNAHDEVLPRIRASTTGTPVPYSIGSSCPVVNGSLLYGSYDSRMDTSITTLTLPVTLSRVIDFKVPYPSGVVIAAWLTGLSSTPGANVSVEVTTSDVTTTQFTLVVDSSCGEALISVGVAWAVWAVGQGDRAVRVEPVYCLRRGMTQRIPLGTMWAAAVSGVVIVLAQDVLVELLVTSSMFKLQGGCRGFSSNIRDTMEFEVDAVSIVKGF